MDRNSPTPNRWRVAADVFDPPRSSQWYAPNPKDDIPGRARRKQRPPPGAWFIWLILSGRGFGKTRTGAEWIHERVTSGQSSHQVLVSGRTPSDVRDYALYGDGGLLTNHPEILYEPSKRTLTWPNGVKGLIRSGANPEEFRGYSGNTAWLDELCAWDYPADAYSNLVLGIRSTDPRICITTTPKPLKVLREIRSNPDTVEVAGSSYENRANLSEHWFRAVVDRLAGTTLGRQEVFAEVLEDVQGALWKLDLIDDLRRKSAPELVKIAVGVDPQGTKGEGHETGIVAVGRGTDGHVYVLEDGSINGSPAEWGNRVVAMYDRNKADTVVGEKNYGGDMVEHTVRVVRPTISFELVTATRGKARRAQPVAALYEQGRAHHIGRHPGLEDEMTTWFEDADWSPNRMDALVWAIWAVMPELGYVEPKKKTYGTFGR